MIPPQYIKIRVEADVIVKPEADSITVKSDLQDNLTLFFHPLNGGNDNQGWPFGGDIYFSDVYKIVLNTSGVARIDKLDIYKDDVLQDVCKNIEIPGNSLLYSDNHIINANYERA